MHVYMYNLLPCCKYRYFYTDAALQAMYADLNNQTLLKKSWEILNIQIIQSSKIWLSQILPSKNMTDKTKELCNSLTLLKCGLGDVVE